MFTDMKSVAEGLLVVSFVPALIYLFLSMYVLHYYEVRTKKKPPVMQWWSFNKEISSEFPGQAKVARGLEVSIVVMALPWLLLSMLGY